MTQPGRREQHKLVTRQALQDAALRMFEQHGYAATTVRDIATAAGVTERTFFRYFPSKEDLVLGEIVDLIPVLQEQVRARPAGESPYTAVLHAVLAIACRRGTGLGIMFSGPPARFLSQATRPAQSVLRELEDGLAQALHTRLSPGPGDSDGASPRRPSLAASVLARACVAAMRSTLIVYSGLPDREKTLDRALELLREAFAALRQG
ncbi:TetR/AcrR family transcriptional regulator [Rugosimonospora africana]|uniref:HTH tetR-type domain-containing protein n=1 Tax=Rugosimonospora africana TaxID=556532 RepID=A0A8J3QTB3_9ACTN|nr:TetR/AcrR family transcriptional regulator [Rugosimonospora africana]GIH14526.1 hypothetical protein Raf01_26980 [Rugosimonospora africana]